MRPLANIHVELTFDALNRKTRNKKTGVESPTDVTTNIYDHFDSVVSTIQRGLTTEFTYDSNGNRSSVSTPKESTSLRTSEDCRAVA